MLHPEENNPVPQGSPSAPNAPDPAPDPGLGIEEEKLPDRRQFFGRLFRSSVTAAEGAFILSPFYMGIVPDRSGRDERIDKFVNGVGPYPFQDVNLELPGGSRLRNLGVRHTNEDFLYSRKHIVDAIKEADVVFLEGPISNIHGRSYFSELARIALRHDKTVYEVDVFNRAMAENLGEFWQRELLVLIGGAALIGEAVHQLEADWDAIGMLRRTALRAIGYFGALTVYPSAPMAVDHGLGVDGYPAADMSFIVDARTIFMLDNVIKLSADYPEKKLLVISGDMHAKGFTYYLSSPSAKALMDTKLPLYEGTYKESYQHGSAPIEAMSRY